MPRHFQIGENNATGQWITSQTHRDWLKIDARRQFEFFAGSCRPDPGFYVLGYDGTPLADTLQELHTTTRLVHCFALGKIAGQPGCDAVIDQGVNYLLSHHFDREFGGFVWGVDGDEVADPRKLAYGHVFVLLAGSSAYAAGHPDGEKLIQLAEATIDQHFWEEEHGRLCDEWNRDWTPFSTYRGMNANMHGVEALLAAYEATGREKFLTRAGQILNFFMGEIAPEHDWRLPEHYHANWAVDPSYSGDPMFRPAGTTPGHSFELARLLLQHWDLRGRADDQALSTARNVVQTALQDAWHADGGIIYTLGEGGAPSISARYWWPVTEAIGVLATFLKCDPTPTDEDWYRKLWTFAGEHFVDPQHAGWFPEIDHAGNPTDHQFKGKPDIYHALQAELFPLCGGISNAYKGLRGILG
ncbi:mannose-6-phosphate isomerase [Actibacterium mucosum KCTC 23349]|uniref:Mannose-6-phosphate isomerase n=1 Tax=Actibacterium mucosum KCTC 23349 TaxID=1454373 RepID=A0A037ZJ42_9RHOB|nr:AGE family epimerase/isomerase [Actibacterium mucosum]KAJ54836.1 mannose-6-phosphate isomerase [Actibacterium mucosum KCTC 23349]